MQLLRRRRALGLATLTATLAMTASAPAATSCEGRAVSKPFARWLDPFSYVLAPGGDFESGLGGWTVSGGASVVGGNEPWKVGGSDHASSLSLPRGASATSPTFCAGLGYPTVRLFSKGGGLLSLVRMDVLYKDGRGLLRSQSLGLVLPSGSWQPSLPMLTLAGLPLLTGSELALRLTAVGGSFSVDDVYVDPFSRH